MKNKKLSARIGCVLGSVFVAVFSVFTFALSPVSVHAETNDLFEDELNAWLSVSSDAVATATTDGLISSQVGLPLYVSLMLMNDVLYGSGGTSISAGDTMQGSSGQVAYYYDANGKLQYNYFPDFSTLDTQTRFTSSLEILQGTGFNLTLDCDLTAEDGYWDIQQSLNGSTPRYTCYFISSSAVDYDLTAYITDSTGYLTNSPFSVNVSGNGASAYRVIQITFSTATSTANIPTISHTYTPASTSTPRGLRFNGGALDANGSVSLASLPDVALYDIMTPAQLHTYLEDEWLPYVDTVAPSLDLSPLPSPTQDPTEPDTGGGSGGCNCHVDVNVEVNPTLELPSDWNEDLVDLETQHYTAPYEDMVIEPWKDLQEQYTTESLRKNTLAKRSGEDSETDDYTFVAPLLDDNIIATIGDYELFCEQLFSASGIKTTVAIVLSAGFVIRFISLK